MRPNLKHLMPEKATLQQLGDVTEASPGYFEPDDRIDIPITHCRFVDGGVSLQDEGATNVGDADSVMYVPGVLEVVPGDMVLRAKGSKRYRVAGSINPSEREVYTKIYLESRQGGNA